MDLMDQAIVKHGSEKFGIGFLTSYRKIDELSFDFVRRSLSISVQEQQKKC
ncbi:hypothetical protein M5U04_07420 [Xenorhabdus sp. XENO-1]|uniref:hypothetical protein n=1 Tax=Xenorhabdus bovienii TaxID=40576 RepID=UPI0020CA3083|nr:hypothetical protein [Xenorhabdus bovienii]MCP9267928.1 hypothetical protein [Xenorhabdus bovienii subsp. africana]